MQVRIIQCFKWRGKHFKIPALIRKDAFCINVIQKYRFYKTELNLIVQPKINKQIYFADTAFNVLRMGMYKSRYTIKKKKNENILRTNSVLL